MTDILLIVIAIFLFLNLTITFLHYRSRSTGDLGEIKKSIQLFEVSLAKTDQSIRDDFQRNREESNKIARENREELAKSLKSFEERFSESVKEFNELQRQKFNDLSNKQTELSQNTEKRLEKMRETVESKLQALQEDNSKKLEKMRETVDEKLQSTLEKRLGESFRLVSERLEKVQKGLGEMQSLANGVGDLKRVLSNVKTRGILGEYQLENILEQILTPDQYAKNVKTNPHSGAFVEFAIKIPSKKEEDKIVWLPLDSKFPIESYQQLIAATEQNDISAMEEARKSLIKNIKQFAGEISGKYIDPPNTTDFALMFLPVEGLYAEVLREPGLLEVLQREYRVVITGPTTLSALLNSLQMGFRTLAIEKRSSEVWEILGAVKTEFGKFGEILAHTKKKLDEAGNVIDKASVRSRAIERKLRDVQKLPSAKAGKLLETKDLDTVIGKEDSDE